jgi:pimeloyl-ACP methyl ester carboxylesterase
MAEDTIELIRALKLKKPHVLGYSMGSCIAQSLAANFGSEIDKLLLVSSTPKFRLAALNYLRAALELRKNPNNLESVLDLYFAFTYSEETLSNNDKLQGLKKEILDNPHLPSVDNSSRQYEALKSFNSLKQLKLIENETLIIHGREDILCLPMEAQYIAAHLKEASFVELYVGHGIPKESPKELTSLILQFLLTNHAHRPDPYSYS